MLILAPGRVTLSRPLRPNSALRTQTPPHRFCAVTLWHCDLLLQWESYRMIYRDNVRTLTAFGWSLWSLASNGVSDCSLITWCESSHSTYSWGFCIQAIELSYIQLPLIIIDRAAFFVWWSPCAGHGKEIRWGPRGIECTYIRIGGHNNNVVQTPSGQCTWLTCWCWHE